MFSKWCPTLTSSLWFVILIERKMTNLLMVYPTGCRLFAKTGQFSFLLHTRSSLRLFTDWNDIGEHFIFLLHAESHWPPWHCILRASQTKPASDISSHLSPCRDGFRRLHLHENVLGRWICDSFRYFLGFVRRFLPISSVLVFQVFAIALYTLWCMDTTSWRHTNPSWSTHSGGRST